MSSKELNNTIKKIIKLHKKRKYDECFLAIEEALVEFPEEEEVLSLKEKIEEEIHHSVEEIKASIQEGNYNEALKSIAKCLDKNPKAFEELEEERKSLEQNLENKFSEAKKALEDGNREHTFELLEELDKVPESETVKLYSESIQQMKDDIKTLKEEESSPEPTRTVDKSEIEKKLADALNKFEEKKFEKSRELITEILELDPENERAKAVLDLINMGPKDIPNLFWQNRFDDALSVIAMSLEKTPDDQEILSYKWRIESVVTQKIEEINSDLEEKNYKVALSKIDEALMKNPISFKELYPFKKKIEQHVKDEISRALEVLDGGDAEGAVEILKEIRNINKTNSISPSIETVQDWIDKIVGGEKPDFEAKAPAEGKRWEPKIDFGLGTPEAAVSGKGKTGNRLRWLTASPIRVIIGAGVLAVLTVAVLLISGVFPGKKQQTSPTTGNVVLTKKRGMDYSGVSVVIDDRNLSMNQTQALEIPGGRHKIVFKKGDRKYEKQIFVIGGKTKKIEIPLLPLEINIQPSGEVWEGDTLLEESRSSHILYYLPGEYTFIFKEEGYQDEIRDIVLSESETIPPLQIELVSVVPDQPGTLIAQIFPSGRVYEGSKLLATFPPLRQRISLSPGSHTLRFTTSEKGCEDRTRTFQINPGETRTVTMYLCIGSLNINSIPPGATIIIDGSETDSNGRPYGTTPRANIRLPAGLRTLTLRHPDYPPKTIQIVVQANKTVNKSEDLRIE